MGKRRGLKYKGSKKQRVKDMVGKVWHAPSFLTCPLGLRSFSALIQTTITIPTTIYF